MNIQITGRHIEVTDSITNYVNDKIGKVNHYFDNIASTKVILIVEREKQGAEAIPRHQQQQREQDCPRPMLLEIL